MPGVWEAMARVGAHAVSGNELEILAALGAATGDTNPRMGGAAAMVKVEELAAVLVT